MSEELRDGRPSPLSALGRLLRRPESLVEHGDLGVALWLASGSILASAVYGAAAGLFEGGIQVLFAAAKVPLIVTWSLLLCAPSLYVFSSLAGAELPPRRFVGILAGFGAMLALLLLGLLPVNWLFSVSSRSAGFLVWFHFAVWLIAVRFGGRYLIQVLPKAAPGAVVLWLVLFTIVSLQVTTYFRPVLWRGKGKPVFQSERLFFLEHLERTLD